MTYPETPGYSRHSKTSKEASKKLKSKDALYSLILNHMVSVNTYGSTVDEMLAVCEKQHNRSYDRSTIAARFTELELSKRIVKTNKTRKTPRNRNATVYILKSYFQESFAFQKPKTDKKRVLDEMPHKNAPMGDFAKWVSDNYDFIKTSLKTSI